MEITEAKKKNVSFKLGKIDAAIVTAPLRITITKTSSSFLNVERTTQKK